MSTPADAGWGDPRRLSTDDMRRAEIYPGHHVTIRNADVAAVFGELIRRLRAAGWRGPDAQLDEWGYARRLKRWAEAAGQTLSSAPMSSWSDHAWGTALDLDTAVNPMLPRRPNNPQAHTTMPIAACPGIAAALGLEWGGSWSEPWDPQHWQVAVGPSRLHTIAAGLSTQEDDVSKSDVIEALREVLHLPATGLAVPQGQPDNGGLAAILVGAGQQGYNAHRTQAGAASSAAGKLDDLAEGQLDPETFADQVIERLTAAGESPSTLTRNDVRDALRDVFAAAATPREPTA